MPATPELEKVIALLDQRFGLEALILFGSAARGATHGESDIDLAALFRARPDPVALLKAGADCERLLGRRIDLDGKCIVGGASSALASFTASLLSRYADLKRVRAPAEAALTERITRARS